LPSKISAANGAIIEELHAQMLDGNLAPVEVLCGSLLTDLRRALSFALHPKDPHLIEASITDTIMVYLQTPSIQPESREADHLADTLRDQQGT
jgi:hypothetical protein